MTKPESESGARDYRSTTLLPATDFPMKAGLPQAEPKWLAKWEADDLYGRIRKKMKGQPLVGHPWTAGGSYISHIAGEIH